MMGSRTSKMKVMSPRFWGLVKVRVFFGEVRDAPDQDIAFAGEILRGPDGSLWQFHYRKDDQIYGNAVVL